MFIELRRFEGLDMTTRMCSSSRIFKDGGDENLQAQMARWLCMRLHLGINSTSMEKASRSLQWAHHQRCHGAQRNSMQIAVRFLPSDKHEHSTSTMYANARSPKRVRSFIR